LENIQQLLSLFSLVEKVFAYLLKYQFFSGTYEKLLLKQGPQSYARGQKLQNEHIEIV